MFENYILPFSLILLVFIFYRVFREKKIETVMGYSTNKIWKIVTVIGSVALVADAIILHRHALAFSLLLSIIALYFAFRKKKE
ncbi:MAG TPA: hypothetical protein VI757_10230 [Bacteroidia bacterium]|nr:hypothetical protein [Bacteroidia bacterium]